MTNDKDNEEVIIPKAPPSSKESKEYSKKVAQALVQGLRKATSKEKSSG